MNITITLQANDRLLNAIETIASILAKNNTQQQETQAKPASNLSIVKEEKPEIFPDNIEAEEVYDIAKVRAIAAEASQSGKKEAIKGILKEMNVTRVTDLPENRFSEFVKKVKAI